jgi:type II secretory pathway pseudopilin PulG
MTLVEMAIAILLTAGGLYLLTGWMSGFQEKTKRDLAIRLLSDLDKALSRYHRATGSYPPATEPFSAMNATVYFLDLDRTRPILESLPDGLWRGPGKRILIDPWGTPLQYHSGSNSVIARANSGKPVFVSAGPDRDFGAEDPARLGDNLRSDDPGPEGFRIHDAMREPLNEEEEVKPNGKSHD